MDRTTLIKVANRESGTVCYAIPDQNIRRTFMPREVKQIPYGELEDLTFQPGGNEILSQFLTIKDEAALKRLFHKVEPEYFYTATDIKRLLTSGTQDEFLDCLDFAPEGVLDQIKELSVTLPLNDMAKRTAILEKLDFDVSEAIKIRNTKFDSGDEDTSVNVSEKTRRVTKEETKPQSTGRRAATPREYKVVSE